MIPVTYPSSVSTSKESQMVVFALPSVAGLQRWTDYIPVKLQATGVDIANSFNTNGYLACDFLQSTTSKQAWVDYIPVFVDNAATTAWQVSETGFIPFNTLAGGGLYYLGPSLDLNFVGSLSNPLFASTAEDYTLNTNFLSLFYQVEAQYSVQGPTGIEQKTFADIVTFTRASTATYFNSAGTLTSAAINEARFDYNPSTLAAQGMLIEEARTNSIRNNTMQGAVAGTPGTVPTNWQITGSGLGTLTQQIVGTGTANGITYIDIKLSGTTSTTGLGFAFEPTVGSPAASSGQTWTGSNYVALVGGSTTNINAIRGANLTGRTAGGAGTADAFSSGDNKASLTATLQRFSATGTLADATTAALQPNVSLSFSSGVVIGDPVNGITLRIGLPQLEQGAFATSVIPTTTTALTRSADVASVNTLSPWYNATEGTLFVEGSTNVPTSLFSGAVQPALVSIDDGTNNNRLSMFYADSGGKAVFFRIVAAGAATNPTPANVSTTVNKAALAYAIGANQGGGSADGSAATLSSPAAIPVVTQMRIGSATTGQRSEYIRRITYYPRRLSNADLQTLTT
jgi:hypothetical protein